MKKKAIIILILLVISLLVGNLYETFATDSTVDTVSSSTYAITLSNDSSVSVPAKSSKTIIYKLCNTNKGVVKYGIGYSGTNINVKVYEDSTDKETGLINYGENKFIKLYIENTGTTDSTASISTILGYENGGDLIAPNNVSLVTEKYKGNASLYITNLYKNATKTVVTNNNITYNYATSVNLMNDRLGGTTTSLDGGNIRYYGANPNNYIYFNCEEYPSTNCELWRIIGAFDGKLKLIRNQPIGTYSWDTSASTVNNGHGVNDWTKADIMKLLNPGYESESIGGSLYYNAKSGNCYNSASNSTTSCNFTNTGLKNDATRNMIATVTWNLGGANTAAIYSDELYKYEIGTNVYSNNSATWTGKIALLYGSDYGYATDFETCTFNFRSYSSNASLCKDKVWLYIIYTYEHLITPNSNIGDCVYYRSDSGNLYQCDAAVSAPDKAAHGMIVRPVLFLNPEVNIVEGEGTSSNPYKLAE